MKAVYKIRKQIEKDLIDRIIKNNRKLDFESLWQQFFQGTLSEGVDKQMYRAYLKQKVQEGKLIFNELEDEYSLAENNQRKKNNTKKPKKKECWKELSILITQIDKNHKKHQQYFQMDVEKREKHFEAIKELTETNNDLLLVVSILCQKNNLSISKLKNKLPMTSFQKLTTYHNKSLNN